MDLADKIIGKLKKFYKNKKTFLHEPFFSKIDKNNLKNCIDSTYVSTSGKYLERFERKIKEYTKAKYVILTNSATSALHLALIASGVKREDEVLLPNLNYIAASNCVKYIGAETHLVDIGEDLGIDVKKLDYYLSKTTKIKNGKCYNLKTKKIIKALVLLHPFGHAADIIRLKYVCNKYKIFLIEDSAECLGSFFNKRHLGTFAKIGIISFNGNKIITTGGGGAILTDIKKLYLDMKILCRTGKINHPWQYKYKFLGYNYGMTNLSASLGLSQIKKINNLIKKKRKLFRIYSGLFKNIKDIKVFKEKKNVRSNYWLQNIIIKNSNSKIHNKILQKLNKHNICARPAWVLLNNVKYLANSPKMNLSNSKKIYTSLISLPSGPKLIN